MLTNVVKYEPKTDWEKHCKVDMNIRDLQEKYPSGCYCCNKFYSRTEFSKLVSSHFKTKKHISKCLQIADEKFISDFKQVSDINRDFEEKCKEIRYLKQMLYESREENIALKKELSSYCVPIYKNLIDI